MLQTLIQKLPFLAAFLPQDVLEAIPHPEPEATCKLKGFTISVEKKEGTLLTFKQEEGATDSAKPASVNEYYEVTVTCTGENPEYPAREKPFLTRYTIGLPANGRGQGFTGGTHYVSHGSRWSRFELIEGWDDGKIKEFMMGKLMPAHHFAQLAAYSVDETGREIRSIASGLMVRKSDEESPAWAAALRSPINYF